MSTSSASIRELKDAKRLVEKAIAEPILLRFTRIGCMKDLRIQLYTDASFYNQDAKIRSTEGIVNLLQNKKTLKANVFSWKTKKIA